MNKSQKYRPNLPDSERSAALSKLIVTPCLAKLCTPFGSLQSSPLMARINSQANSPIASSAKEGISSPYFAVIDHVPTFVSANSRLLHLGQLRPSILTNVLLSSTLYAPVTSGEPSTVTVVMVFTGTGNTTSDSALHEQLSPHSPHTMLNH